MSNFDLFSVKGQVALVTGASGGLGRFFAIALASAALMPFGVKSMSMSNIAKLFGWPEQTHEALDDVLMCAQLFRLCYPLSARNAIKVRMLLYRARIALYLNPLRGK